MIRQLNGDAVRMRRTAKRLTLKQLAQRLKVSEKTAQRYEKGGAWPEEKLAKLAQALGCGVQDLAAQPEGDKGGLDDLLGRSRIAFPISDVARLNLRLVARHYRVHAWDILEAAPWMFALLAEMSLAERREALAGLEARLCDLESAASSHLHGVAVGAGRMNKAIALEEASIADRDVFGRPRDDDPSGDHNPQGANLFQGFLRRRARALRSDALSEDAMDEALGDLPSWPLFEPWVEDLTDGDPWARRAPARGHAKLADLPEALKGPDARAGRAEWLAAQVPAEEKARHAAALAALGDINLSDEEDKP